MSSARRYDKQGEIVRLLRSSFPTAVQLHEILIEIRTGKKSGTRWVDDLVDLGLIAKQGTYRTYVATEPDGGSSRSEWVADSQHAFNVADQARRTGADR